MKRLFTLCIIILIFTFNAKAVYQKIGIYNTGGRVVSLDISENIVVTAKSSGLIEFLDISNPNSPQLISSIQIDDYIGGVTGKVYLKGDLVYLSGDNAVHFIDISDLNQPIILGNIELWHASDIIIENNIAYIAEYNHFYIYDISNFENPQLMGTINNEYNELVKNDSLIYACDADVLHIINITDPQNPEVIYESGENFTSSYSSISYSNNHVFISSLNEILNYDVSDPLAPILFETIDINSNHGYIYIDGDKIALSTSSSDLRIFQIEEDNHINSMSLFDFSSVIEDIVLQDNIAYIANSFNGGLQIVDISDPSTPYISNSLATQNLSTDLVINENFAYIMNKSGIDIVSISDPLELSLMGSYFNTIGQTDQISISEDKLVLTTGYPYPEILFIDITVPELPILESVYKIPNSVVMHTALFQTNTHAFIGGNDTIYIFEISDLQNPILSQKHLTVSNIYDIIIQENIAFVSMRENGILILDVSDINAIQELNIIETNFSAYNLSLNDNILMINSGPDGLQLYDIANPISPINIGAIKPNEDISFYSKPLIKENKMLLVDYVWNEIYTFNINDINNIQEISSSKINIYLREIKYHNDLLFAAGGPMGLVVMNEDVFLSIDHSSIKEQNSNLIISPNPFHSSTNITFHTKSSDPVYINIYNINGKIVKSYIKSFKMIGLNSLTWNGKSNNDLSLPRGSYIIKIQHEGETLVQKIQYIN